MEEGKQIYKKSIQCPDVRRKVMQKIRKKHIKMKSHFAVLAEKIGLEAALFICFSVGVILTSVIFHFLIRTKVFRFVKLGFGGFKIFLFSLPFGYFALVLFLVILSVYVAKKLDIPCRVNTECGKMGIYLFLGIIFLGVLFSFLISEAFLVKWNRGRISNGQAIYGRIKQVREREVWVEDENGRIVKVKIGDGNEVKNREDGEINGKYFRAVGKEDRDENDEPYFQAESVLCCDND